MSSPEESLFKTLGSRKHLLFGLRSGSDRSMDDAGKQKEEGASLLEKRRLVAAAGFRHCREKPGYYWMNRKLWIGGLVFLGIVFALAWRATGRKERFTVLPDGSRMALEETHFDTSWKFLRLEGSLAQRWSLKLPVNWRLRFKLKSP